MSILDLIFCKCGFIIGNGIQSVSGRGGMRIIDVPQNSKEVQDCYMSTKSSYVHCTEIHLLQRKDKVHV